MASTHPWFVLLEPPAQGWMGSVLPLCTVPRQGLSLWLETIAVK